MLFPMQRLRSSRWRAYWSILVLAVLTTACASSRPARHVDADFGAPTTVTLEVTERGTRLASIASIDAKKRRQAAIAARKAIEDHPLVRTALAVFALLAAALGGGWYVFREDISAAMRPAPVASIAPELPSTPVPEPMPDSGAIAAAESTTVSGADTTANAGDPADAIADLAARLASAPVMDVNAPADSVVVRVGSQTMQTVLFVNDQQVGILGGMGLVSVTVPPGPVKVQVRKVNCRDWDTTFTPVTGRRYSFMERSPTC